MRTKVILLLASVVACGAWVGAAALEASGSQVVGLRRLTENEYRNSIADILGKQIQIQGTFEPGIRIGGLTAASTAVLSITPAGFESYSKMADSVATQAVSEAHRKRLISCQPKSDKAPDDACASQVLSHYGLQLFRRPLTAEELRSRVSLARTMAKSSGDFYAGLRYGMATLLQSPEFLFRKEIAVPAADKSGYVLDTYSRATRLSYLLWDTTPDAELLKSAESGDLNTPAGLEKQVDRLMASPRLEEGMRAFFTDMLMLETFANVSKDSSFYPKWAGPMAAAAQEETLRSTLDLALRQNGDMRELMVTRKTQINRALASIYGVPFSFNGEWAPHEFGPESGRSGLLTQISMLAMFSHPGRSSPTKRGVAMNEILLCEPTPTPPNNVDFSEVNDTAGPRKTVRERLMAHAADKTCSSCHNAVDPIGLSLEGFDTIGGRRDRENGEMIDVSATLAGKSFHGAEGLGKFLYSSPKFPSCVARKLYSYANGLNSEEVETAAFKGGLDAFQKSGYRLRALVKGLVTDPKFFNASLPEAHAKAE
ncbi:MAG: DUF1592 domain-containing protein [Pseudomonadota bacterium]